MIVAGGRLVACRCATCCSTGSARRSSSPTAPRRPAASPSAAPAASTCTRAGSAPCSRTSRRGRRRGRHAAPAGAEGRLRVRTGSSAPGYLNDPVATAAHFEDGWFQPGDVGGARRRRQPHHRRAAGQQSSTSAASSSPPTRSTPWRGTDAGIDDACAVVLGGEADGQRLAILIAGSVASPGEVAARLRAHFPALPRFVLVSIAAIPRGSMGKVNRADLGAQVGTALAGPVPGPAGIRPLGTY